MTINYIKHDHDDRAKALHSFLVNDGFTEEEMEHIKFKIDNDDTSYIDLDGDANESYMILTDEEADQKVEDHIRDSLWAFNPQFLVSHTDVDITVIEKLQSLSEDSNEAIFLLIKDFDHFVDDAILSDGRGHFLASYDGVEEEYSNYFIYRC